MSTFLKLKRVFLLVKRSDIYCGQRLCFALYTRIAISCNLYSVDLVDSVDLVSILQQSCVRHILYRI